MPSIKNRHRKKNEKLLAKFWVKTWKILDYHHASISHPLEAVLQKKSKEATSKETAFTQTANEKRNDRKENVYYSSVNR